MRNQNNLHTYRVKPDVGVSPTAYTDVFDEEWDRIAEQPIVTPTAQITQVEPDCNQSWQLYWMGYESDFEEDE